MLGGTLLSGDLKHEEYVEANKKRLQQQAKRKRRVEHVKAATEKKGGPYSSSAEKKRAKRKRRQARTRKSEKIFTLRDTLAAMYHLAGIPKPERDRFRGYYRVQLKGEGVNKLMSKTLAYAEEEKKKLATINSHSHLFEFADPVLAGLLGLLASGDENHLTNTVFTNKQCRLYWQFDVPLEESGWKEVFESIPDDNSQVKLLAEKFQRGVYSGNIRVIPSALARLPGCVTPQGAHRDVPHGWIEDGATTHPWFAILPCTDNYPIRVWDYSHDVRGGRLTNPRNRPHLENARIIHLSKGELFLARADLVHSGWRLGEKSEMDLSCH